MNTRAYKNLNNGKWSIKQLVAGKWVVVGHCDSLAMNNVKPTISDKRFDHVRHGNHREVFAWITGELCWTKGFVPFRGREALTIDAFPNRPFNRTEYLTFRPFDDIKQGFHFPESGELFTYASCAYFTEDSGVWAA